MLNFYLVRHGAKEAIPFDPRLTEVGLKQAEVTAEYLKDISFNEILTSPKLRAKQTAETIAKPHSLMVRTDARLVERLEWENDESFNDFITEWNKTDINRNYLPKKGSSSKEKGELMKDILDELSNNYKDGNVLIVTHGGSIGDLLRHLFTEEALSHKTEPLSGTKYIDILECSVTTIQKNEDSYKLLNLNDISHLSIPLI